MEPINLGNDPKKDQAQPNSISKPENATNPASISINFTPKIPVTESKPQLLSLEIKKEDLKKVVDTPEKKGLFSGLFSKKPEVTAAKPSSAWGGSLDVPKDLKATETKPAEIKKPEIKPVEVKLPVKTDAKPNETKPVEKNEFFASVALKEKSGGSKLMENIATQKAKLEQPKMEDLLGKKSTILEKTIEQEALLKMKKKLRVVQFMAFFVLVVAVAVNGYLYYQLSPGVNALGVINYNFDSNLRNDVFNLNQSLKSVQTDLNKYRFLIGQLNLNQFGYESTRFIDGIHNLEEAGLESDKLVVQSVVEEAKSRMPLLLAEAKKNLTQGLAVDTFPTRGEEKPNEELVADAEFQRLLRIAIGAEKAAIRESTSQSNLEMPLSELSFFDNTVKLIGNVKLVANLNASTVEAFKIDLDEYEKDKDPAQRMAFKTFIDNLLASTKVNLAMITNLRNSRVKWADVIDRVETITNKVNSDHNSGLGSGNTSNINYSGIELDSKTGKVSITGVNTTRSGTNREVVTYLIEAFEASSEFKNVANRSFPLSRSKNQNGEEEYTMNFKIDMEIENGAFSKLNAPIADLQNGEKVAVLKIPVKRK